jgi:hypothetical protein
VAVRKNLSAESRSDTPHGSSLRFQSALEMTVTVPGLNSFNLPNTSGMSGCVSSKRFDLARITTTAKGKFSNGY